VVVQIELNSHVTGYGETLPRSYVTGESVESVVGVIRDVYLGYLLTLHPESFAFALEAIDALPWYDHNGASVPGARAGVELALLDAYSRHFGRRTDEAAGWLGFNDFVARGSIRRVRCSGILATSRIERVKRLARAMWWYGLRDFKLKVGDAGDDQRLAWLARYLAKPIASGKASLRIDVNGAWSLQQACERLTAWRDVPIDAIEQPLSKTTDDELPELKRRTGARVIPDESLVTFDDAERLADAGAIDGVNIRISKCGGFLPSLRLAQFARKRGLIIQLGSMVGETSILSAAARKFLELVPGVRYAEGNLGKLLLAEDVSRRSLRFGYGGRIRPLAGLGWGIQVEPASLEHLAASKPHRITL
jgi:muconate cycloisomerase